MSPEDFDFVVETQLDECRTLLKSKGSMYAPNSDRLHNFRVGSVITGQSMYKVLGGMLVKHTTSLFDMCMGPTPEEFPYDLWNEKITDHINYLILLKAIIVEAQEITV